MSKQGHRFQGDLLGMDSRARLLKASIAFVIGTTPSNQNLRWAPLAGKFEWCTGQSCS